MQFLKISYVKYGLIMTASLLVCLGLMEVSGNNQTFENKSPIFFIYQFIMPAVIWWLAIAERKRLQKGKLSYKQGLLEGFNTSVVFGLTSPFVFGAYYLLINPEILDYVKAAYGMPEASTAMIVSLDLLAQVFSAIVFGSLYGAIISLFLKSKKS